MRLQRMGKDHRWVVSLSEDWAIKLELGRVRGSRWIGAEYGGQEDFARVTKEVKIMIWHYGFRNKLNKFIIFLKFCTTGEIMPGPLPEDSPRNLTWLKVHKRRFKIT